MTTNTGPYPVVDGLIDMFGDWLKHRRTIRELGTLDAASIDGIARDLRIASGDLGTFVRLGPHAAAELPKVLRTLGIDVEAVIRTEPLVLRDMERVCVSCVRKAQCNNDIEIGVMARDYVDYCVNAPTMQALLEEQDTARLGSDDRPSTPVRALERTS